MDLAEKSVENASIRLENVGGIDESATEFSPGVTVLVGRNATNRTSLLKGIMAALGSDEVSMKADANEAEVELTVGDRTYTRRLRRRSGTVVADGDPYLEDPTLPNLFAFLLESNEARRTVARGDDLRDLIMRPVDTEAIEATIEKRVADRKELEDELDELDSLKNKLPSLEEERTRLRGQIDEKKAERRTKEEELESIDADVEETREAKAKFEEKLEALRAKRSELDDIRYDLETERDSLESLRSEREELEAELKSLPETPTGAVDEIDSRIRRHRDRKQDVEAEINDLQNVIGFNEELLDGENEEVFGALGSSRDTDDQVTDQLLENDVITCWTCGSTVDAQQIEATLDHLRELSQQKLGRLNDIEADIAELQEERRELEQSQHEYERIDRQLTQLDREINDSEGTIERLQNRRESLTEEIEAVEADVEEFEGDDYSELLDLHRGANQLTYELGKLETDLDSVEESITSIEARLDQEDDVKARLEGVRAEIEDLRTRIERIEQNAIEQFNEHMGAVLDLLEYENLDRIWLERVKHDVREGRRRVTKNNFELHIIRSTDGGTAYEDIVDHLSESEREVVGLVFALAGYLAHEVYEQVPFMLLDSLEAIDAERIATLVDYLEDYTEYLLVALLPEDAAALPEAYERVSNI